MANCFYTYSMDEIEGPLLFFVAVAVVCLIFFGIISTVQKTFKKVPQVESPLSTKAKTKLDEKMDGIEADRKQLMENQKERITDLKRQSETSNDQLLDRTKDLQ